MSMKFEIGVAMVSTVSYPSLGKANVSTNVMHERKSKEGRLVYLLVIQLPS